MGSSNAPPHSRTAQPTIDKTTVATIIYAYAISIARIYVDTLARQYGQNSGHPRTGEGSTGRTEFSYDRRSHSWKPTSIALSNPYIFSTNSTNTRAIWGRSSHGITTTYNYGTPTAPAPTSGRTSTSLQSEAPGTAPLTTTTTSSEIGDWPSRDPIGERGGLNLYAMVGNNAMGQIDFLGLATVAVYDGADDAGVSLASDIREAHKCYRPANGSDFEEEAKNYDHRVNVTGIENMVDQLESLVDSGVSIDQLLILDHGDSGSQDVGNDQLSWTLSDEMLERIAELLKGGQLILAGCNVAKEQKCGHPDPMGGITGREARGGRGEWELQKLANKLNVQIVAWEGESKYQRKGLFCCAKCFPTGNKKIYNPNGWNPFEQGSVTFSLPDQGIHIRIPIQPTPKKKPSAELSK